MAWNWSGNDAMYALPGCEENMNRRIKELNISKDIKCSCKILIDNGRTKLSSSEFTQVISQYEWQLANNYKPLELAENTNSTDKSDKDKNRLESEKNKLEEELRLAKAAAEMLEKEKIAKLKIEQEQALKKPINPFSFPSNRYALVIGNDKYLSAPKLNNAVEDAKSIAENLTKVGYKVTLKSDIKEKEMKAALRDFKSKLTSGDEAFFFFAGHGIEINNQNFLIPIDTVGGSAEQIRDEAIALNQILQDLGEQKVKLTIAMIDACRNNPFTNLNSNVQSRFFGQRGLAPANPVTGQMIIYSAGTGQLAIDKLGPNDKDKNGLFTRVFIREMQKPNVTIDRILRNVKNEVIQLARSVGQEQVPAIYDQSDGDFYFIK